MRDGGLNGPLDRKLVSIKCLRFIFQYPQARSTKQSVDLSTTLSAIVVILLT